jgi:hypothetical protein
MDADKLEEMIGEINEDIYSKDLTAEKLEERISDYTDENGKLDLYAALNWVSQEARDYTTIFAHDLVLRLAHEGYLVDPSKHEQG